MTSPIDEINEIDEIDEIYDPGASPVHFSALGLSGSSMSSLPSIGDVHVSHIQLQIGRAHV